MPNPVCLMPCCMYSDSQLIFEAGRAFYSYRMRHAASIFIQGFNTSEQDLLDFGDVLF